MKKKLLFLVLTLLFLNSYSQCAMCKAVVENGDNKMAEGLNFGIVYLMVFPYLILIVGVVLYMRNRKKRTSEKISE